MVGAKKDLGETAGLPATGYVRQAQLLKGILPFSAATLWRKVAAEAFPAPVKLSAGVTAWKAEDVRAWMDGQTSWPRMNTPTSSEKEMPMTDVAELIQKLAAALATQLQPAIPVQVDLWDVATIARVLKRSEMQVRNGLICLPDFPKAIRLLEGGGRGKPLYRAVEVLEWVDKYQDKN